MMPRQSVGGPSGENLGQSLPRLLGKLPVDRIQIFALTFASHSNVGKEDIHSYLNTMVD